MGSFHAALVSRQVEFRYSAYRSWRSVEMRKPLALQDAAAVCMAIWIRPYVCSLAEADGKVDLISSQHLYLPNRFRGHKPTGAIAQLAALKFPCLVICALLVSA
jgi:hypothetical protein